MYLRLLTSFILLITSLRLSANEIDTQHILLKLHFNWEKRIVFGIAEITFITTGTGNKIVMDAGNLSINTIQQHKEKLKFKYDGGDTKNNLEIDLNKLYNAGELITIQIDYHSNHENRSDPNAIWGSSGKGLRFQSPTKFTPLKRRQIWSSGEPDGNKYWFPCNEEISDIHTTEIIATVEKPLIVISNGTLIETLENKNNYHTFHFKSTQPFPNYLVSIVIGEYADVLQNKNGTSIHNFGYPNEIDAVKATTELLPDMLQFMEEKTGHKYPYSHYSQVVVQDYPFPGLNSQHCASMISDNYIDDYGVHKDFKYLWDGVAMQALAGQWFGNLLMPKSWDDIWLNNAFTQYFSGLYSEKCNSKTEYLTYILPFEKSTILSDWNSGNIHPIVTNKYKDLAGFTSDNYSKYRGALVLRMLQKELGEENWWQAIRYYVNTYANKQVTTKDFQTCIEAITGKSYKWFFDQWLLKTGLPQFEVTNKYLSNTLQLVLNIKQNSSEIKNSEFENATFFQGKIQIEINNKIETIEINPEAENTFTFLVTDTTLPVNFNFEETWICKTDHKKTTFDYLNQLEKSQDILSKINAQDNLANIYNDTTSSKNLKDDILHSFLREIRSETYWRYRFYTLASLRKIIKAPYDEQTVSLIISLIEKETGWLKTSAITTLGNTKDKQFKQLYLNALNDESDRVINAACIALGKTKSKDVLEILINRDSIPSWKSQNRISALNGLEQLGDTNAVKYVLDCVGDNQSPRWYLATPVWDYPFTAIQTLRTLGKGDKAYPILYQQLNLALKEDDLNDIFQLVNLINMLQMDQSLEIYPLLKKKFKKEVSMLSTITNYENQLLESLKK